MSKHRINNSRLRPHNDKKLTRPSPIWNEDMMSRTDYHGSELDGMVNGFTGDKSPLISHSNMLQQQNKSHI